MKTGAWIHTPRDTEETDHLIEQLAQMGIGRICAIFKGPSGPTYYPSEIAHVVEGYEDPAIYGRVVDAAHRCGMEVEAWICTFTESGRSRLLEQHPECVGTVGDTSENTLSEDCKTWVCAARDTVQAYELSLCAEVLERYPTIDRLHLDYVRYPWSNGTVCRCKACQVEFREQTGFDLMHDVLLGGDREGPAFDAFVAWRCGHIRRFVEQARALATQAGKGLTAAVFPFYPSILFDLGQDWVDWCRAGLLDAVYPMNYNSSPGMVSRYTGVHTHALQDTGVPLFEGLWIREWLNEDHVLALIRAARQAGTDGLMLFTGAALAQMPDDILRREIEA